MKLEIGEQYLLGLNYNGAPFNPEYDDDLSVGLCGLYAAWSSVEEKELNQCVGACGETCDEYQVRWLYDAIPSCVVATARYCQRKTHARRVTEDHSIYRSRRANPRLEFIEASSLTPAILQVRMGAYTSRVILSDSVAREISVSPA